MFKIEAERCAEQTLEMIFILILRQKVEDAAAVVVEDDDVDVDIVQFSHNESVHIMIKGDIPDDERDTFLHSHCHRRRNHTVYAVRPAVGIDFMLQAGVKTFNIPDRYAA